MYQPIYRDQQQTEATNQNRLLAAPVQDGYYTVVYESFNDHRTLKVETPASGNLAGRTIIGYLAGSDNEKNYRFFGFFDPRTGQVSFWRKFATSEKPERLRRIEAAVAIIARDPGTAGENYALRSSRCCRCHRTLTVPASIHRGLGPDCATKRAATLSGLIPEDARFGQYARAQAISAQVNPRISGTFDPVIGI